VPAVPVEAKPVQVRLFEDADVTTIVPQEAVLLLPPQLAVTDTLKVPAVGFVQFGALVHVRPLETVVLSHLTAGVLMLEPAVPV